MSHGDKMVSYPKGWTILAHSGNSPIAAFADPTRRFFGVQFHPEVAHTPRGREILDNFVFRVCGCQPSWTMEHFIESSVKKIRDQVGDGRVLCALSGGVDSAVAATLVHRAIQDRLICVFVNNGLLRKNEAERVCQLFAERFGNSFRYVDASEAVSLPSSRASRTLRSSASASATNLLKSLRKRRRSSVRSNFSPKGRFIPT